MDGAFETVKVMGNAVDQHFYRLVVFVAANFAVLHVLSFLSRDLTGGHSLKLARPDVHVPSLQRLFQAMRVFRVFDNDSLKVWWLAALERVPVEL